MDQKVRRGLLWVFIALAHLVLLFAWPGAHRSKNGDAPSKEFFITMIPASSVVKAPDSEPQQPSNTNSKRPLQAPTKIVIEARPLVQIASKSGLTATNVNPASSISPPSVPSSNTSSLLNIDVTSIAKGLKTDFEHRDRITLKPAATPISKFGEKIAAAAIVSREGYREERVTLGDGRPVTKVITPYGTYCILHRKPGEIVGNELATVPVTCGNL